MSGTDRNAQLANRTCSGSASQRKNTSAAAGTGSSARGENSFRTDPRDFHDFDGGGVSPDLQRGLKLPGTARVGVYRPLESKSVDSASDPAPPCGLVGDRPIKGEW